MVKYLIFSIILFSSSKVCSQFEMWNTAKLVDNASGAFAVTEIVIDNFNNKYVASLSIDEFDTSNKYGFSVSKYNDKNEIDWKNKYVSTTKTQNILEAIKASSDNRRIIQYGILFKDTVNVKGQIYTSNGGIDALYLTINAAGDLVEVNQFGGNCNEGLGDIKFTDEAIYWFANFGQNSNSTIDDCSFISNSFLFENDNDNMAFFLAKVDKDSYHNWHYQSKLNVHNIISNIDVVDNFIFLTGAVKSWGTTNINGLAVYIPKTIDFPNYIAQYDTSGNPLWMKYFGLKGVLTTLRITGIYSDKYGVTVAMIGLTSDAGSKNELIIQGQDSIIGSSSSIVDFFIINYNNEGEVNWSIKSSNVGDAILSGLIKDGNFIYVTGYFSNELHFANDTTFSQGSNDIFVACYNQNGEEQWIKTAGGKGNDTANSIALDQAGRIYVCGGTSSNPVTFGDITVETPHPNNVYLARLSDDPILSIQPINSPQNQTTVYPNPATERLWLQQSADQPNNAKLLLYDVQGNLIHQNFKASNAGNDIQFLPAGIYFLKITYNNSQQQVIKWCKQ